jgi:hypothetical protein
MPDRFQHQRRLDDLRLIERYTDAEWQSRVELFVGQADEEFSVYLEPAEFVGGSPSSPSTVAAIWNWELRTKASIISDQIGGSRVMAFQRKKPAAIGIKAPFPGFIEPALATSIEKVPSGARWLHEIKIRRLPGPGSSGERSHQEPGAVTTGRSASARSPTTHGTSGLGRRSSTARSSCRARTAPPTSRCCKTSCQDRFVAFDLLFLNGRDLRKLPLAKRKAHLKKIADGSDIQFSESFEIDGRTPARSGSKASPRRSATAPTPPAGATTGLRKPVYSERRW